MGKREMYDYMSSLEKKMWAESGERHSLISLSRSTKKSPQKEDEQKEKPWLTNATRRVLYQTCSDLIESCVFKLLQDEQNWEQPDKTKGEFHKGKKIVELADPGNSLGNSRKRIPQVLTCSEEPHQRRQSLNSQSAHSTGVRERQCPYAAQGTVAAVAAGKKQERSSHNWTSRAAVEEAKLPWVFSRLWCPSTNAAQQTEIHNATRRLEGTEERKQIWVSEQKFGAESSPFLL